MSTQRVFADLHIHIGRTEMGRPVKVTGARDLTFANIVVEASERKGLDMIGIIDAASPAVQQDIAAMLDKGAVAELDGGGLRYGGTTILLGCELEVRPEGFGLAHVLCYVPSFDAMQEFTAFLSGYMRNTNLSTQRFYGTIDELFRRVEELNGVIVPAHVFTPFKSVYGSCADRMADVFPLKRVSAVELGLSADTEMADRVRELHRYTFLTNSDAHSLSKIGREYNELQVNSVSFSGFTEALQRKGGAAVTANFGLHPRLGKYHRTMCKQCESRLPYGESVCSRCGSRSIIKGVRDRIGEIATASGEHPPHRPPYIYQIPLEFIPKVGPSTLQKLLDHFGTEMNVLHRADEEELAAVVGQPLARRIVQARDFQMEIEDGGGGVYGKVNM